MSASGTLISIGTIVGIYALLALALNVKFGFTGILDFGHVAFYLVGAYVAALLIMPPPEQFEYQNFIFGLELQQRFIDVAGIELMGGLGWLVAIAVAVAAAGFLGLIVALPAIRLRADYLAIALLGVSVILVRIVQTEGWIANGPDALRGYSRPFSGLFPLPGESGSAAILLGLVVFTVWAIVLYVAAREAALDPPASQKGRLVHGVVAVTTLGVGYLAVRRTRTILDAREGVGVGPGVSPTDQRYVIGTALAFGLVAMGASLVGLGSFAIFVFLGAVSLAAWVVAGIKVRAHYREYDRRAVVAGLVGSVGLFVALAPTYTLGGLDSVVGIAAVVATFVLLAVYFWGVYYAFQNWERVPVEGSFLAVAGITTLWLLTMRYFVVSIGSTSPVAIIRSTRDNFLWLVEFDPAVGASMDYSRFFFVVVVGTVVLCYFLLEMVAKSPYGRVLRAIRDDEDVALSLGKNTFLFKVQSMMLGSAVAGLAGAYAAIYYRSLGYTLFHPLVTFFVFLIVILGGKANNRGVILGAALYWIFVRGTVELAAMFPGAIGGRITILRNAIIGLLLILVLYYRPAGLWKEEPTIVEVPDR